MISILIVSLAISEEIHGGLRMRAIFSQSLIFSCLLSILVLSSFPTSAFASPNSRNAASDCLHLYVHLNEKGPATKTCLDGQIGPTGISEPDCGSRNIELILWWDAKLSGPNICFSGTGGTNLGSYPRPALALCSNHTLIFCSWDNNASSFEMRDSSTIKTIYAGIGGNGTSSHATVYHGNLANTPIGNDNASSIGIEPLSRSHSLTGESS
jgi:hypothetical protein